jgi:hypothetical protein
MVIALDRSNVLVSGERPADKRAFAIVPGPMDQGNRHIAAPSPQPGAVSKRGAL